MPATANKYGSPCTHVSVQNAPVVQTVAFYRFFCVPYKYLDAELSHLFTGYLVKHKIPWHGIKILSQAIEKIRFFDSQLTAVHADLYQLCLCAKVFQPAFLFLDVDVTAIAITDVSLSLYIL